MTETAEDRTSTQIPMRAVMTAVLLAVGTLGVSQTSVGVVLPVIVSELGGTQSHFGWVLAASMLASVATGPLWAAAATRWRASSMFLAALCVYTAGALLAGLAPTADALVAIRVLQGCGIGGVFILANIIVSVTSPPERRPRYLGYVAATMSAATLGGPIIGGLIDGVGLDWRWNFYVGFAPATAAIIALAVIFRGSRAARPTGRRGVDVVGLLLVPASIAVALVGVTLLADDGGVLGVVLTAGGTALLVVAIVVEARLRSVRAILPVRLFAQREPATAFWGALALGLLGAVSILLIQYLQYARDVTPLGTSLWTLPIVGCAMVASLWAGARVERTQRYRGVIVSGAVGAGVGVLGFAVLPIDWSLWWVSVLCGCIGVGNGLVMQNLTVAAQNSVTADHLEDATGTVSLMRMLGGAVGMPLYTALYSAVLSSDLATTAGLDARALPEVSALDPAQLLAYESATAHAFSVVAWASLPLVLVVLVAGIVARDRRAPGVVAPGVDAPGAMDASHADPRQETSAPHAGDRRTERASTEGTSRMSDSSPPAHLVVDGLTVRYGAGTAPAVDDVAFEVAPREKIALVGESGSGKSTLGLAVAGFLTAPGVEVEAREMRFAQRSLTDRRRRRLPARVPGIAMIFQDAMTSLDPVWTVGDQIVAVIRSTTRCSRGRAVREAREWLGRVGLHDTQRVMGSRPYELSGGMRQRVMLAVALSGRPQLVIADEPTSALDASVARATMDLLDSLVDEFGLSLLIISHDIGLCTEYTDRTLVMYHGQLVDSGVSSTFAETATHPYAKALLSCIPSLDSRGLVKLPTLSDFVRPVAP